MTSMKWDKYGVQRRSRGVRLQVGTKKNSIGWVKIQLKIASDCKLCGEYQPVGKKAWYIGSHYPKDQRIVCTKCGDF